MVKRRCYQKGIGLVEVLVAAAIIVLVVLSLVSAYLLYFRAGLEVVGRVQATLLAEEAVEAIKFLRDDSWASNIAPLSLGQPYYLVATSSTWQTTTTPALLLGKFDRTVRFYSVNRDGNGNIVSSGGVLDSGTRKAVVTLWWPTAGGSTTRAISTYVSDLFTD